MLTGSIIENFWTVYPDTGEIYWRPGTRKVCSRGGFMDGKEAGVVKKAARGAGGGYRVISLNGRKYRAHHIIWAWVHGTWPQGEIDHINGNRDDNRIENLREVTASQNRTNKVRQSNNKSGFKWVSRHFNGQWRAEIRRSGKRIYSSLHSTPEEAYAAACDAARALHGNFFNPG